MFNMGINNCIHTYSFNFNLLTSTQCYKSKEISKATGVITIFSCVSWTSLFNLDPFPKNHTKNKKKEKKKKRCLINLGSNWCHFRHMNRKLMNLIHPRIFLLSRIDGPQSPPHSTVALKPWPKCNLPSPITFLDPPLGFSVGQLIPQGTARSVSKPIQCHPWGLHVPIRELKILLQLIQHCPPSSMNAKVLKGQFKIWNVWLYLHLEHFPSHQGCKEKKLFWHGKD